MTGMLVRAREEARPLALGPLRTSPITVLDVGSTKVGCFIARPRASRGFSLLGRGYQLAQGIDRGDIVDAGAAEESLLAAVHEAEQQAGETVRDVVLVTGAGRPRCRLVRLEHRLGGLPVRGDRLQRLFREGAQAAAQDGEEVLHVVPVELAVDDGRPVRDARGMRGERLSAWLAVVTVQARALDRLMTCLERCHLRVAEVVAAPYAAGIAATTEEEADRGCLVLDFGGGLTTFAHFAEGRLAYLDSVPYGGVHVTGDIAYGLSTSREYAERLKTLHGSAVCRALDDDARLMVPQIGDGPEAPAAEVPRAQLTRIIRARVEEILEFVQEKLRAQQELFDRKPPRSMVLTGGGAELDGLEELVEEMFGVPVRRGRPDLVYSRHGVENEPALAAASGALSLALGDDDGLSWSGLREEGGLMAWFGRFTRWLSRNF